MGKWLLGRSRFSKFQKFRLASLPISQRKAVLETRKKLRENRKKTEETRGSFIGSPDTLNIVGDTPELLCYFHLFDVV